MTSPLVILDRDGVINQDSPAFVKSAAEWLPLPGSLEGIALLSKAGFAVCVASNQSGIGRGLFTTDALYAMHRKLRRGVARHGGRITRIVYCPHRPDDGCDCRKPQPGLLRQIGQACGVALDGVPVVGDSRRDLDAAAAAGARPVLVLTGNGRGTQKALQESGQTVEAYPNLLAFAEQMVARRDAGETRACN